MALAFIFRYLRRMARKSFLALIGAALLSSACEEPQTVVVGTAPEPAGGEAGRDADRWR